MAKVGYNKYENIRQQSVTRSRHRPFDAIEKHGKWTLIAMSLADNRLCLWYYNLQSSYLNMSAQTNTRRFVM